MNNIIVLHNYVYDKICLARPGIIPDKGIVGMEPNKMLPTRRDLFRKFHQVCFRTEIRDRGLCSLLESITTEFGIPPCKKSEDLMAMTGYDGEIILQEPACLETRYELTGENTTIIVFCQSNERKEVKTINTFFTQLLHVTQCCFHDTIFGSGKRICVTQMSESLGRYFLLRQDDPESVKDAIGPRMCKGLIVNYDINEKSRFVRNNTYSVMVSAFKNISVIEKFSKTVEHTCLDTTPEFAPRRKLEVRVSRGPKFCDTNTCIRKYCLNENLHVGTKISSEQEEFYMVSPNVSVNQMNSSSFGKTKDYRVFIQLPCEEMLHFKDIDEWNGRVLLASNGLVFDLNYDTNYTNCSNVIYNKSDTISHLNIFFCSDAMLCETDKSWSASAF